MQPSDISRWQVNVNSWLASEWVSEGTINNPGANTILADTGQLAAGWYDFTVMIAGNANASLVIDVQHRDVPNTATIAQQRFALINDDSKIFNINNYKMGTTERLRITNLGALTGDFQASILYRRRC